MSSLKQLVYQSEFLTTLDCIIATFFTWPLIPGPLDFVCNVEKLGVAWVQGYMLYVKHEFDDEMFDHTFIESRMYSVLLRFRSQSTAFNTRRVAQGK